MQDYLRIVSDPTFGRNRQMLVLLLGKLKEESAIPVLIDLLEDEEVRLHAISALGQFKREEFRGYFERFQNDIRNNVNALQHNYRIVQKQPQYDDDLYTYAERHHRTELLQQAIAQLPPQQRTVTAMRE